MQDHHRERQRALGLPILRFHDARHHWATESLRAGVPVELVARQLGHVDGTMVLPVYGRFIPHDVEWNHWREQLAARQAAELKRRGVSGGAIERARGGGWKRKSPRNSKRVRGFRG
ncbi:MAG TPA: tyrosine-type recombinase/integrase [Gemmatimonadales bacterium]|nr:tyrosine-type recombinase/integrase [Gemmatimonadales bacterium]